MLQRKKQSVQRSGLIPLNKPKGITSSDAVVRVKRSLGLARVGHTGTLDPSASGVLVIVTGGACKIVPFIGGWEKEYLVRARLGVTTDTDDAEGEVTGGTPTPEFFMERLLSELEKFKGEIAQIPPLFSAKKFKGRPHYSYARKGIPVERKASKVFIRGIELVGYEHPILEFKVICSKGTYIRAICRDLGEALGCGAILEDLVRTKNGPFAVADCTDLDSLVERGEKGLDFIQNVPSDVFGLSSVSVSVLETDLLKGGGIITKRLFKNDPEKCKFRAGELLAIAGKNGNTLGIFEALVSSSDVGSLKGDKGVFRARRIFN